MGTGDLHELAPALATAPAPPASLEIGDPSVPTDHGGIAAVAEILARAYVRLLLGAPPEPVSPQQLATCGRGESAMKSDKELDAAGPQSNPL